ncbi:MAG: succinate dehydrogenase, hydrophobic membrane anchor protein [Thiogranum sp.]|nr:succinate dehydrogenase, hydrophobic membrane anchor protein [Thiogranum sp.]
MSGAARTWLLQRFTAIYLAVFLLSLFGYMAWHGPFTFAQWQSWFAHPVMAVASILFVIAALLHAWIGVRDVLIDYIHAAWLRLMLMALIALVLLASLLWVLRALALAAGTMTG